MSRNAWAAIFVPGLARMGAREINPSSGTMGKCTLCVDRIYDEKLPEEERQPACVLTCPTNARHFGDFDDPDSNVSKLTKERDGQTLQEELGYKPVNRYLPPKEKVSIKLKATKATPLEKLKAFFTGV